jgi:hypothetical protein
MTQAQINNLAFWLFVVEGLDATLIKELINSIAGKSLYQTCIMIAASLESATQSSNWQWN